MKSLKEKFRKDKKKKARPQKEKEAKEREIEEKARLQKEKDEARRQKEAKKRKIEKARRQERKKAQLQKEYPNLSASSYERREATSRQLGRRSSYSASKIYAILLVGVIMGGINCANLYSYEKKRSKGSHHIDPASLVEKQKNKKKPRRKRIKRGRLDEAEWVDRA